MARSTLGNQEPLYAATRDWLERVLPNEDSLFIPGTHIWTPRNLGEFGRRVFEEEVTDERPFLGKLQSQLAGAGAETTQLAAEIYCVYLLMPRDTGARTKREQVEQILGWNPGTVRVPEHLLPAFDVGIASLGAGRSQQWHHIRYLVQFTQTWQGLTAPRRDELLRDPWAFKSWLVELPVRSAQVVREALLHLTHPDTFETMISVARKREIAERLGGIQFGEDVDRALLRARAAMAPRAERGERFFWWDPDVKPLWDPDAAEPANPWDTFIACARRFYEWDGFGAAEIDYKLRIAEQFEQARSALLDGGEDWLDALHRVFNTSGYNLTDFRLHGTFLDWCRAHPDQARDLLAALWQSGADPLDAFRAFLRGLPMDAARGPGGRASLGSVLLMALDPHQFPIYRSEPYTQGMRAVGFDQPPDDATGAEVYAHGLRYLDAIRDQSAARNLALRDRLDAQSVLFCVMRWPLESPPVTTWPAEDQAALARLRGVKTDANRGGGSDMVKPQPPSAWIFQAVPAQYDLAGAVKELPYLTWTVRQHRDHLQPNDRVYLWEAGAEAGVVATATVLTPPGIYPDEPGEERFWRQPAAEEQGLSVRLRIDRALAERIRREELRAHPVLKDLGILVQAQGTNFLVTPEQASVLDALIAARPNAPSGPGREPPAPVLTYAALAAGLAAQGLCYSDEVLSNYLLALQTKRFVILSGISGTGKTRLALEVAEAFAREPEPALPNTVPTPDGGTRLTVRPYMLAHRRLVLPASVVGRLGLGEPVGRSGHHPTRSRWSIPAARPRSRSTALTRTKRSSWASKELSGAGSSSTCTWTTCSTWRWTSRATISPSPSPGCG